MALPVLTLAVGMLLAAGCAAELPSVTRCDRGGPVERSGCDRGLTDAELHATTLGRPPAGAERNEWLSGYLLGRAESRLQDERVRGRRLLYSGETLMVLSAIGVAVTVGSLLFGISDLCIGCFVALISGSIASVETAIGVSLFASGLHLELQGERGLRDLGAIP
jgi:hypothetical protein